MSKIRWVGLGLIISSLFSVVAVQPVKEENQEEPKCTIKCCWCKNQKGYPQKELWQKLWFHGPNACWSKIATFECADDPKTTNRGKDIPELSTPCFKKGIEEAKRTDKLLLFIGKIG